MRVVLEKSKMHSDPESAAELLENYFRRQPHAIVAYSGGVDSALLAFAAHKALGNQMVAVLADSPSLSRRESSIRQLSEKLIKRKKNRLPRIDFVIAVI